MKSVWLLVVFFQMGLHALYQGNPAALQIINSGFFISEDSLTSMKVGYQEDWVFNRRLKGVKGLKGKMDKFETSFHQGILTFNLIDKAEFYASVGSMNSRFSQQLLPLRKRVDYQSQDKWTVGSGLLLLMQWGNTALGFDGKFQYATPSIKWIILNGIPQISAGRLTYREWQGGLAISHTVEMFTPYLSATYSHVHAGVSGLSQIVLS